MRKQALAPLYWTASFVVLVTTIAALAFGAGLFWSMRAAHAQERVGEEERVELIPQEFLSEQEDLDRQPAREKKRRVVYRKNTKLDFEGLALEGEWKNPAEFYFERRPEEKFDSLVKRRKDFHREMLRDVVMTR